MIPTDRLLLLLALGFLPALAAAGNARLLLLALGWDVALLLVAAVDAWRLPARTDLEVERECLPALPLAREAAVGLRFRNGSDRWLRIWWRDLPPRSFRHRGSRGILGLPARSEARRAYQVEPLARGDVLWGPLTLRWRSRLGLVWRQGSQETPLRVRVHPDPRPRRREEEVALRSVRQGPVGLRQALLRGEGREFESLREYRPDDEMRRVDWKATARRGELIVRQYEAERDQRVVVLLDCGRSMSVRVGDLTRLDHLVEAALRLGRAAVDSGDRIGLIAFSGGVRRVLPPGKGQAQLRRLAEALTELESDTQEPDYETAFMRLRSLSSRRTLVVVLTEVTGERAGRSLRELVRSSARRHLPVVLSVVDRDVAAARSLEPEKPQDAFLLAVGRHQAAERARLQRLLRAGGAYAAEVDPEEMSLEAVRRYLDIKARGLL